MEIQSVVGVGNSGFSFARRFSSCCRQIPVTTVEFSKERFNRVLMIDEQVFDSTPVLVDDLAVSGLTMSTVIEGVSPTPDVVAVGMLFNSKSATKLIGVRDLRYGFKYSRIGGGRPPINSVETLWQIPERCGELAMKYFGVNQSEFCVSINKMERSI